MKHIRKQRSRCKADVQMEGVKEGDIVTVHMKRKEIPCVVRVCGYTMCSSCLLRYDSCMLYRGWSCPKAFIPIEEAVE